MRRDQRTILLVCISKLLTLPFPIIFIVLESRFNLHFPKFLLHFLPLDILPPLQRRRCMNLKPIDLRLISPLTLDRYHRRINLKEYVVEGRPEVCTVDLGMTRGLGVIEVFALSTVEFHGFDGGV